MITARTTPIFGRLLLAEEESVDIMVGGERLKLQCLKEALHPDLTPGDWIEIDLEQKPESDLAVSIRRVTPYPSTLPFPPIDSDWYRFHQNGGSPFRNMQQRALLIRAIRSYFESSDFLEVDTPAMALCPGLEIHLEAAEARLRTTPGGPIETRWLVTSPEYHMKRLLSAGFERIFQIGKAFRSGESGHQHNPEFQLLEWYRAHAGWQEGLVDTTNVIRAAGDALKNHLKEGESVILDLSSPWPRRTFREAILEWGGFDPFPWDDGSALRDRALSANIPLSDEETSPSDILIRTLVERVEPALPKDRPMVIYDYPECMAALARRSPDNPTVAERFEVYLGGVEVANGFGELVDSGEQRERCIADLKEREKRGFPLYPIDERFLSALAYGCPPATGVALGIDRVFMALRGLNTLDDTLAFPISLT